MNRLKRHLFVLSSALIWGCGSNDQRVDATRRTLPPPTTLKTTTRPTPVDLQWAALPDTFAPSSPTLVTARLLIPRRDAYESTAAYAARVKSMGDASTLAFEIPLNPSKDLGYDPDDKRLYVRLPPYQIAYERRSSSELHWWGFLVFTTKRSLGEYAASNAFGVEKAISRQEKFDIAVALKGKAFPASSFDVPLDADKARVLVPRMRVLLIVKPAQVGTGQFVTDTTSHLTPTLTDPVDVTTHLTLLWASRISVWIYDRQDRTILWKKEIN